MRSIIERIVVKTNQLGVFKQFIEAVKKFNEANWWIYFIYAFLMFIILIIENNSVVSVFVISTIHFVADIFIMMMASAYSNKSYKQGSYFQIVSLILFLSLKIHTGLVGDGWHYLAADPIYILAALKNYYKDVKQKDIRFYNYKTIAVLSFLIISFLFWQKYAFDLKIFNSIAQYLQTMGIFLFAIALSVTDQERLRYQISIVALFVMVTGSGWETINSLLSHSIVGLAFSYCLLPLTVLVFYIKSWPLYMKPKPDNNNAIGKEEIINKEVEVKKIYESADAE